MSQEVLVPDLGEDASEATVAAWHKRPGEPVEAGEVIAEVMTDKVNIEVISPASGVLEAIIAAEGASVRSGQAIARIAGRQ